LAVQDARWPLGAAVRVTTARPEEVGRESAVEVHPGLRRAIQEVDVVTVEPLHEPEPWGRRPERLPPVARRAAQLGDVDDDVPEGEDRAQRGEERGQAERVGGPGDLFHERPVKPAMAVHDALAVPEAPEHRPPVVDLLLDR